MLLRLRKLFYEQSTGLTIGAYAFAIALCAIGYAFSFFYLEEKPQQLAFSVLSAILTGGIFAILLKTLQFLGLFEYALKRVIYFDPEFLLAQRDLKTILGRVFQAAIQQRFPELSNQLRDSVFQDYLVTADQYYYQSSVRTMRITAYDRDTSVISFTEELQAEIRTFDDKPVIFTAHTETNLVQPDAGSVSVDELGGVIDKKYCEELAAEGKIRRIWKFPLVGHTFYNFWRNQVLLQVLDDDPVIHIEATHFISSSFLTVHCDVQDLEAIVIPLGIPPSACKMTRIDSTRVRYAIDRLVFPGQGFLLTFRRLKRLPP